MKKLIYLSALIFSIHYSYGQTLVTRWQNSTALPENTNSLKSVVVKETKGFYTDTKTGKRSGPFRVILAIDSVTQKLVNVVQVETNNKEHVTVYYFNNGQLSQVITGVRKKGETVTNNMFSYTEEDNKLNDADIEAMSPNSEKMDLLRMARLYQKNYHHNNQVASK